MTLGGFAGYFLSRWPQFLKVNEKLLSAAIYLLLFLLGLSVGLNKTIINHIDTIGFQAIVITLASITGSVAVCWLIYKIFFRIK